MIEITVTKFHYLTSTNRQHLQLMTTYNNSHCQAHLLADLPTIPLMYNLVLWNNFLKKMLIKQIVLSWCTIVVFSGLKSGILGT